jgi:putative iron-regulated protein
MKTTDLPPSARCTTLIGVVIAAMVTLAGAGCGGGDDDDDDDTTGFEDRQIIENYADDVVVTTYTLLAERAVALDTAVVALADAPDAEALTAARDAWVDARQPWEQSEAFLFGPVASFGYDPAMDSWPVNQNDLEAVLADEDPFTAEYIAGLTETQKGFHTIEYLIFGEAGAKTADDFTDRELDYLVAITAEFRGITELLETSWTESIEGGDPYRDVLATAGEAGNTAYPSLVSALQEILGGMSGICDEVANGKIADPYDAHDPNLVESQFSYNSLLDFEDNIRGVENAYLARVELAGTDGRGLDVYVASLDPDLDARFQGELTAAMAALQAIPMAFPLAITDEESYDEIEAAQQAIRTVQDTIDGDLTDLVLQ